MDHRVDRNLALCMDHQTAVVSEVDVAIITLCVIFSISVISALLVWLSVCSFSLRELAYVCTVCIWRYEH